ncbi:MAG: hypothetical protein ACE5JL_13655 [Dehalococcoidia bacterium]
MKRLTVWLFLGVILVASELSAAYKTVTVIDGGVVTGKVTFKGEAPEPKSILISKDKEVCGTGNRVIKEVNVGDNGALRDVVVFLDGIKQGKAWNPPGDGYLLNQEKCAFHPYLQVIEKGAELTVLNSDPVTHNIHTYELIPIKRKTLRRDLFNVRQTEQGHKFTQKIKLRRGKAVKVNCDIHNFMLAWLYVIEHPYYAAVGEDGSFSIADIPPGTYKVSAWHPILGTQKGKVTLAASGKAEIHFEFSSK